MNLRVLFVEDSADDVELMLRRLREADIEPRWDRVDSEAALREALVAVPWELALVDYNLPGFGGLQALAVLAEAAPDLPAITVSGAISEEMAVATITAGAVDYVLKDNLTRLAPAVRRAVEGAELRRQERRAAEQARGTQFAIEHSSQTIAYVGRDGTVLYANAAAGRLGEAAPDDIIGSSIRMWSPLFDEERWLELWASAVQHPPVQFETTVMTAGGRERRLSITLDYSDAESGPFVIVYARDITAQRAVEERAQASEQRYERLADNASDIIFRYDLLPAVRLTYINPVVEAITGHSPDEHYADPQLLLDIVDPRDVALVRRMIESPPLADEPLLMRWIVKDGVTRWMESRIVPVRDSEGRLLAVEGITRDVTERKRAEEALQQSEAQLRTLIDTLPDLVWLKDPEGVFLSCNRRFESLFGVAEENIVGKTDYDFVSKDLADFFRERDKAAAAAGGPTANEEELEFVEDGHKEIVETIKTPIVASDGRLIGVLGVGRDITARRQAEEELKQSEARLTAAQAVAKVGSWETDLGDLSVIWSEETYRIFEIDADGFQSTHPSFLEFVHPEDRAQTDAALTQSFDSGSLNTVQHRIVTPRGLVKSIEERWRILRDDEGRPVRAVGTCQDITERKQAEEEVRRQAEQLRRTVEGAVLAMSHVVETRDPYTAGHERRVSELATAIAAEMGLEGEALSALRLGGLIHDVGKVAVPAEILAKPGLLSEVELNLIKQHPETGFEILAAIDFGLPVAEMVLQHHERLDGSGYPKGLSGAEILPEARILAVADVVEAMSSHRPYRAALGMEAALAEVRAHAGVKYDAAVVAACVRLFEEQGFAFTP